MPEEMTREELVARWRAFLDQNGAEVFTTFLTTDARSVAFPLSLIREHDETLASSLFSRPRISLYTAELAAGLIVSEDYRRSPAKVQPHVRVFGLPNQRDVLLEVRELRAEHGGRLVAVPGLVRSRSDVRPLVVEAAYQCERCHNVVSERQSEFALLEPAECYKDQGGCGRTQSSTRFKLLEERSTTVDAQRVEIQEFPERVKDGDQPQKLTAWLLDDLTGQLKPGQRVVLNGVVRGTAGDRRRAHRGVLNVHLEVVSIDTDEKTSDLELSPADVQAIEAEARRPGAVKRVAASIAPSLYGLETEKLAVALQLFGGTEKETPDHIRLRGDIHVLLLGDPSTGKSQLLHAVKTIHYRGIGTTGRGVSGAGLTAAVVKDKVTGEMSLEAGALVMASGGICAVDEMDKMDEEDRGRLHPAMEQGVVEISKAGIHATMIAKTSILAAANPKHGSWQQDRDITDQVDLPTTLLSRFDAVFIITDKPDGADQDRRLARHVLRVHHASALAASEDRQPAAGAGAEFAPPVPPELLRKWIFYARARHRPPLLTAEGMARLESYFLDLRKQMAAEERRSATITVRQLEGLVRFAEASARLRLASTVEEEDIHLAIHILEGWVHRLGTAGSKWNLDVLYGAVNPSVQDDMNRLLDLVREEDHGAGANKAVVLERAERDLAMKPDRVRYIVEKLYTEGRVFERDDEHWRAA